MALLLMSGFALAVAGARLPKLEPVDGAFEPALVVLGPWTWRCVEPYVEG